MIEKSYNNNKRKSAYVEKLKDPRWQKMRLEILQRDDWTCLHCGDKESTLHVHHRYYEQGKEPWKATIYLEQLPLLVEKLKEF